MRGAMIGLARLDRPIARQAVRFAVVGVANTLLTLAVIMLVRDGLGATVGFASAAGYVAGMIQGFILSRRWTFADIDHATPIWLQIGGFVATNLVCGALFTRVNVWLVTLLPLPLASLASAAVVMPVSFALNRWGVFRARRPAKA